MEPTPPADVPDPTALATAREAALADLPRLDLGGVAHAVVVAPHPDDEALGTGGTLALLGRLGVPVDVVAVTDGERARQGDTPEDEEVRRRVGDARRALRRLEIGSALTHRLRVPDGRVAEHEDVVAAAVRRLLTPSCWCLVTWADDGHPDHASAARATAKACVGHDATLLAYVVRAWAWLAPGDERVPWERARRVDLPLEVARRKAHALDAFVGRPGERLRGDLPASFELFLDESGR